MKSFLSASGLQRFVSILKCKVLSGNKLSLRFFQSLVVVALFFLSGLMLGTASAQNFRGSASAGVINDTLSLTIDKPAGTVNGDVMIAAISVGPVAAVITTPTGWTLIRRTDQTLGNTPGSLATYWKLAGTAEPTAYSWSFSNSTGSAGSIATFYNIYAPGPIHLGNGQATAASLTHATPALTTTVPNTMLVAIHTIQSAATWVPPTGMTESADTSSTTVPNATGTSIEMSYAVQTAAGATGAKTATASDNATNGITQIIALFSTSSTTITYQGTSYCVNGGTASVTRTGIAGGTYSSTPGLSINATTGAVTLSTSSLGTYTVTYTYGAYNTSTTITVAAATSVTGTSTETCVGGSTGTITATGSGGTAPYTYSLNTGAFQSSATFTGLAAGTYTLNVKSASGCVVSTSVTIVPYAASTDNQATAGTNTWIGHVYDGQTFNTYMGQYTEPETFNQIFGGTAACFNVVSNGATRSVHTETFSVRYRMASTKKGLYIVGLGSDDGTRLYVDGTLVYNNFVAQGFTSKPNVLIKLNGASSLLYEFFEASIANQVVFQNLALVLANTLTVNSTQSICPGNPGAAISGDSYGVLPAGITLSGTGYQWSYSLTPGGARTNIAGATGATFTPSESVAPFNVAGTYYLYRNATLRSTNNVSPNPYIATSESNAATVTVTTAAISYAGSPYCNTSGTASVTRTGSSGGTYSSTAGLSVDPNTGDINLAASTPGTYTVTYTINASGVCSSFITTASVTITAPAAASITYEASPYCSNAGTVSVSRTGTADGTYSSTTGLTIDPSTGAITLGSSTAGTYTVTYSIAAAGGCPAFTTTTGITIVTAPLAGISYLASSYCSNAGIIPVTQTGTAGGTYTSATGLFIDSVTGAINLGANTPGAYTVTYSVAATGCPTYQTTTNITVIAAPEISRIPTLGLISNYRFEGNANDATGNNDGTLQGNPAVTTDRFNIADKAYFFNGSSQYVSTTIPYNNPNNFTISIWFKTSSVTGGKLIGFGKSQTGLSTNYDRHLYMNNAGQIYFGINGGGLRLLTTATSYNDGMWHLATASLSSTAGMVLYMDGVQVGNNSNVVNGENFTGYWRIGYDNVNSWPSQPASFYFNGSLDDVLIYQRALTPVEVDVIYKSPDGAGNNGPLCTGSTLNLTAPTVNGASYLWTGPNGFTSALQNPTLTYNAVNAGVYTLQVTRGGCTSTAYTNVVSSTVAGQWTGSTSTDWSDSSNWCNGALPTASTNVLITEGATRMPSISDSAFCNNLTIAAGASVTVAGSGTLNIAGTLTNNGTYADNGTTAFTGTSGQQTFSGVTTFNNLTLNNNGGLLLPAALVVKNNLTLIAGTLTANNFNISIRGSWINNASITAFAAGTGTVTFNGTITQSVAGSFATSFNNFTVSATAGIVSLNINANISGNLIVSAGIFDLVLFTANRVTPGGSLTISNNAVLKIGGTNTFPVNYTSVILLVASTVEYSGTDQMVAAQEYGNLSLSSSAGTATKTLPATPLTIMGNLASLQGAGTSVTFTAASSVNVAGNVSLGASTTFNGGSFTHTIGGNWTNAGTFNGNTGTVVFSGPGTAIGGSGAQNFNNLTVAAAAVSFASSTVNLSGNLATTGPGSFTQAQSGTLIMNGTGKTISGLYISLGNLSVGGSVTTSNSLALTGNLAVSGSFTAGNGILTMTGASKTISGSGTIAFYVFNPVGSISSNNNFTIASGLVVDGSFSASAGTATFTGTSFLSGTANLFNVTVNGTSLQLSASSVLGIGGSLTMTSGSLDVASSGPNTVNFNGPGAQNVNNITYSHLVLSNGYIKTAVGAFTTLFDITIGTGTTFNPSSYTHSTYGNWINNGSFTAGTSTIQFLGPANGFIRGGTTFNILQINTTNAETDIVLQSSISAGTVVMTKGVILTGDNTLTITGTRTGNGIILGHIRRTHAFITGVSYAFESPANTINFSAVSGVTSVTVSVAKGSITDFPFSGSISRVYDIEVPAGTYIATLRLHYEDVELNGNDELSMGLWHFNGTSWTGIGKTGNDTASNYVEQSGLTDITNRWTASDNSNLVRWNGSVSSDWNTPDNWTVAEGAGSRPPSSSDIVDLGSVTFNNQPTISNTITVKSITFGSAKAVTLTLAGGGSLHTLGDINGHWTSNTTHTINVNNQTLSVNGNLELGDGTIGHAIHLNIGSGTVTTDGSVKETGGANITFTGTGTLNINNDFIHDSGIFTAGSGTVIYRGTANQDIAGVTYNDLTINKTGGLAAINDTVSIAGNFTITSGELDNFSRTTVYGNVTIATGATFNNYSELHVHKNWNNNGTYIPTGSSIYFEGSGNQNISASTFHIIYIIKPSGTAYITGNVVITGEWHLLSGTLDLQTFEFNRNVPGGGTTTHAAGATLMMGANNGPRGFSNNTLDPASITIVYGSDTQYFGLADLTLGHLILRGTGLKVFLEPTTVNDLTIDSLATMEAGSSTLTVNGNWINNGTFIPSTSLILLNGSSKTITGNTTFNKVTVSGSYELLNNITFNDILTVTSSGIFSAGPSIQTILHGDFTNNGVLYSTGTTTFTGTRLQTLSLINSVQTVGLTINFNGSVSPVLNSTSVPQFGYLNINNTGGINPSVGYMIAYALNIASGASFNGGSSTHTILGSVTNNGAITSSGGLNFLPNTTSTINLGTNFSSTGTVVFGGSGVMTLAGTTDSLTNVTISNTNAAGVSPSSNWNIANDFNLSATTLFNAGGYTYLVGGNIINNGTLNPGTSTFTLNGTGFQEIYSASSFNGLTINKPAGAAVLTRNATVNGTLNFVSGRIQTGINYLIQPVTGTVTGAAQNTGWVNGLLQKSVATGATSKTFEIGDTTYYTPATIAFQNVSTTGNLVVHTTPTDHPQIGNAIIDPNRSVNRYWTVTNTGIVFTTYDVTLNYVASDVDPAATTSALKVEVYNGSSWSLPVTASANPTSIQGTGIRSFSDFAIGEVCHEGTSIAYTASPYCSNGGIIAVSHTGTTGGTYGSTAGLSIDSSTGSINPANSVAGTYTVTYTVNALGGCRTYNTTANVTITQAPAATIAYNTSPYCSNRGSASVTRTGTAGGRYSSTAGLVIDSLTGAINLASTTPGAYLVTYNIAASGGCATLIATTTVQVYPVTNNQITYTNGTSGLLCSTASENGTVTLTAPVGTVFTKISFASYGTPGGTCPSFTIGNCHAVTSQSVVESYFLGKNSANIFATNGVFTDPCVGTPKRLYVQAFYSQPICTGTSPGTITGTTPIGGNGAFTYLWEISTTSASTGFTNAPGTNNTVNYTAGTLTQTTWYRRTITSGGCANVSQVVQVTVTPTPNATISYPGTPYCSNAGIAPVTRAGTAGGTYTSTMGLTINSSTGGINTNTSTPGTYTVTYALTATGGCAQYQTTATVEIVAPGVWSGAISTSWYESGNWICGAIPTAATSVTIPAGLSNYPVLSSGIISVLNITIQSGASLSVTDASLQIGDSIINNGSFDVTNGTIVMNGSEAQTIPAGVFLNNTVKSITINNAAGVTLGGALDLTDVLTLSNGSLASNGYLTLKSSANGTARVAAVTSFAAEPVSGHVTVERYIPGRRRFRLITSSVTTSPSSTLTAGQENLSIWGNWQNQGNNVTANSGTLITGGGSADGFDTQTSNTSLYTYDDVNRRYSGFTSANGRSTKYTPLKAGIAYYMFVYGDRLNSVTSSSPNNTVLRATGKILTGTQVYNTGSAIPLSGVTGRFTLLGNPFVAPLNWAGIPRTDLSDTYWGWDANLSSTGGYVTVSTSGSTVLISPFSGNTGLNQYIQPGQGFFVRTEGPAPALTIREEDKTGTFNYNAFRISNSNAREGRSNEAASSNSARTANTLPLIAVNLMYNIAGNSILADGVLAAFAPTYANSIGREDAYKLANNNEGIAILNSGSLLSIDARHMPSGPDTLFLQLSRLTRPEYTLQIFTQQLEGMQVIPYLQDNYLNTLEPLMINDTNQMVFTVTPSDPASYDANRFRIVFGQQTALPVNFTSLRATAESKSIQVEWSVAAESGIEWYEVQRCTDGVNFVKAGEVKARYSQGTGTYRYPDFNAEDGKNLYRIRYLYADGRYFNSKTVSANMDVQNAVITLFPNPVKNHQINLTLNRIEKGRYTLVLLNAEGKQVEQKSIEHTTTLSKHLFRFNQALPQGTYYLQLLNGLTRYSKTIYIE